MIACTAKVVRVVDGDTFHVVVNLGFGVQIDSTIRIAGVDAPDKKEDPAGYEESKSFLQDFLAKGDAVRLEVIGIDGWRRAVSRVFFGDLNVGDVLVDRALAVPWKRARGLFVDTDDRFQWLEYYGEN